MKFINHFHLVKDLSNWKDGEYLISVVSQIYDNPPLGVDRIKKDSLPYVVFHSITRTLYERILQSEAPTYEISQIWRELTPYRNTTPHEGNITEAIIRNIPIGRSFEYNVAKYYEAIDIFGALYFLFTIHHFEKEDIINSLQEKARFPVDDQNAYTNFDYFMIAAKGIKCKLLKAELKNSQANNDALETTLDEAKDMIRILKTEHKKQQEELDKYQSGQITPQNGIVVEVERLLEICRRYYADSLETMGYAICLALVQTNPEALPYVENLLKVMQEHTDNSSQCIIVEHADNVTHQTTINAQEYILTKKVDNEIGTIQPNSIGFQQNKQ